MAIDTRDKRASILGLGLASLLVLPQPGAIDQPDRQHVAYCYRGIDAATPYLLPDNIIVATQTVVEVERTQTITLDHTQTVVAIRRTQTFDG